MIYDLSTKLGIDRFNAKSDFFIKKGAIVDLSEKKPKRTLDQNRLMWLFLACISNETGNNKDFLHEFFKQKFLGMKNIAVLDSNIQIAVSTTKLNTAEMTNYLNRIQEFANTELGILLPNPDDLNFNDFYETYKNFI